MPIESGQSTRAKHACVLTARVVLQHGQSRVTALQQAMEEMAAKKPHPYYWAPFIALGRDASLH